MVHRTLAALLLTFALAPAQTPLVLPASHAGLDGSTSTNVPFGRSTAVRLQCAYSNLLFAAPGVITQLAFRFDGNVVGAGKTVDCEIRMSTLATTLVGMSPTFASNRGADEVVVLPRTLLTLAGQTTAAAPSPFLAPIQLAQPFAYDPRNGSLLLDITVFAQPPGSYALDATYVCDSPELAFGPAGCPQASSLPLRVESLTTQVLWGYPWLVRTLDAPSGALVLLALGTMESGAWNGVTLPYDLGALGAPGCAMSTDPAATFFGTALADGTTTFTFAVPNAPRLIGTWLRYQAGVLANGLNALGIATSQAKKLQVCGFEPVARVWATGSGVTVGVRELGVAPVVQITLQ